MQTHTCTHAHTVSFTEFFVQLYASKHKNGGIAWLYLYILFPLCILFSLPISINCFMHAVSVHVGSGTWLDKIPYGWAKEIIICPMAIIICPTCFTLQCTGWWYHTLPWVCCTGILKATGRTGREVLADLEVVSLTSVSARLKFIMWGTKCLLIG